MNSTFFTKSLVFPASLSTVLGSAFKLSNISSLDFSACTGITKFEEELFMDAINLISIKLPPNLEEIIEKNFFRCWGIKSIEIPTTVVNISASAFEDCISLESVFFPKDSVLKEINTNAFKNTNISNLTLPNNVRNVYQAAFAECKNLNVLTFGKDLTEIRGGMIEGASIKEVVFQENLVVVYPTALSMCLTLTNITVDLKNKHFKTLGDGLLYSYNVTGN